MCSRVENSGVWHYFVLSFLIRENKSVTFTPHLLHYHRIPPVKQRWCAIRECVCVQLFAIQLWHNQVTIAYLRAFFVIFTAFGTFRCDVDLQNKMKIRNWSILSLNWRSREKQKHTHTHKKRNNNFSPLDGPRRHTFQIRGCRRPWPFLPFCRRSAAPWFGKSRFCASLPSTNTRTMTWRWYRWSAIHPAPPCIFATNWRHRDATCTAFHRCENLWSDHFWTDTIPCFRPYRADFCQPKRKTKQQRYYAFRIATRQCQKFSFQNGYCVSKW